MSREAALFLRTLEERLDPTLLLERVVEGEPDPWQRQLLHSKSETIMVLASRRIGKSTTVGVMAAQELAQPRHEVIIICPTLAQSQLLFAKIAYIWDLIGLPIADKRRTLLELHLENGSVARCVPAGQEGTGARGHGIKKGILCYDEAAFIPDKVFGSTLAIAEDDAKTILITTPGGKSGRAFEMWTNHEDFPDVERIRACSLDLPRMAKTVERARRNMSPLEFKVEHGLAWMGRGTPFFDPETISKAYTDTPPLALGDIYAGL